MDPWTAAEGFPSPLGINWVEGERALNFALYSKNATGIILLLFSEEDFTTPIHEFRFNYLKNKSGRIWHCWVSEKLRAFAKYYGYIVEGPADHSAGHRFDSQKILLDPYAA